MVFVDTKKFACRSCIQGHRSSSCQHTERPLFEVKKKGRPVSQCDKCRELRQSRRVHSKCECRHNKGVDHSNSQASSSSSKPRRSVPLVPTLPNGLKDVFQPSLNLDPLLPNPRQQAVTSCTCKARNCRCQPNALPGSSSAARGAEDGLAVLARAAALCCSSDDPSQFTPSISPNKSSGPERPPSQQLSHKHKRHSHPPSTKHYEDFILPPINHQLPSSSTVVPTFPIMPPISVITSLAGTGCTCGLKCRCPGCIQHRGPEHASKDHKDCAHGCGSCIDYDSEIELTTNACPSPISSGNSSISASGSGSGRSIVDQFLSRAAALPRPPSNNRMMGVRMDPTNLVSLHTAATTSSNLRGDGRRLPVDLPKLRSCGGQCGSPGGQCVCQTTTTGGCCSRR